MHGTGAGRVTDSTAEAFVLFRTELLVEKPSYLERTNATHHWHQLAMPSFKMRFNDDPLTDMMPMQSVLNTLLDPCKGAAICHLAFGVSEGHFF